MTTPTQTKSLKPLLFHVSARFVEDRHGYHDRWIEKLEALLEKDPAVGSYLVDWKPALTGDCGVSLSLTFSREEDLFDIAHYGDLQKKEAELKETCYELMRAPEETASSF